MPLVVKMIVIVQQEIQSIPSVPASVTSFGRKTKTLAVGRCGSMLPEEEEEMLPGPLPPTQLPFSLHSENGFPAVEPRAVLLFPLEMSGWSPLCRACFQVLSR